MGNLSPRQLLHRFFRPARRPAERPSPRRSAVRRLAVEQLEDRTVLSTLAAIPVFNPSLPNTASSGGVSQPFISYDGRYIAYAASAPNLVLGQADTAPVTNIYLYDTQLNTTTLVSHVPGQLTTGANGESSFPVISGDDRFVAYGSEATDLVAGQAGLQRGTSGLSNVFLYDIGQHTNTLISHAVGSPATSGNEDSFISGTTGFGLGQNAGRYLLFLSRATNLVTGQDSAVHRNLFLYDTLLGTTTLVSHAAGSTTTGGTDDTFTADISQDGSTIAYNSLATNLVPFQSGQQSNVFLYNTFSNTSTLVSGVPVSSFNQPSPTVGAGLALETAISADGSFVAYTSLATNLVVGQTADGGQPTPNAFGYSRITGQTVLLSGEALPSGPSPTITSNGVADRLAVSSNGSSVAFISNASDLYPTQADFPFPPGQGRNSGNVFVDRLNPSNPTAMARELATYDVSLPPDPFTGLPAPAGGAVIRAGYNVTDLSISADGRIVTYQDQQVAGQSGPLVLGQNGPNLVRNSFVYQESPSGPGFPGANALLSRVNGTLNTTGNFDATASRVSGNGLSVAFVSQATNLQPSNVSGTPLAPDGANLFVFPAFASGPSLLSSRAVVQASAQTFVWGTSGDGRYVVFTSNSPQVLPGQADGNADQDAFVFDRQTGATRLVSHVPGASLVAGNAGSPATNDGPPYAGAPVVISQDGNWIAFVSDATNLVPGQTGLPQTPNVFLFDNRPGPSQGTVTLISGSPLVPGQTGTAPSFNPVIDADGGEVAFVSYAGNIFPGLTSNTLGDTLRSNVFVYFQNYQNTGPQLIILSDQDSTNTTGNGNSAYPSISDDGRYVAFESLATNLLSGTAVAPMNNIYLSDLQALQTVLVSHDAFSTTTSANASSFEPVVSPDGSTVAFASYATDLVSGQRSTPFSNVFVYDNRPGSGGTVQLLSGVGGSATFSADGFSDSPALSADGSRVAFRSGAPNLVTGQVNNAASTSNVFLFNRNQPANPVTLVSHAAGQRLTTAAGNSEAPSIDGAGDLIAYLSTATNLVPGQQGGGVDNVFLYGVTIDVAPTFNGTALLSGQGGSLVVPSTSPAFMALLSRDPVAAFDLLTGGGDTSVAFINTLVEVTLSPNTVAAGSPAGTVVGTVGVSTVFVGQFLPPTYGLPGGEANNGLFALGPTTGGRAPLVTRFQPTAAASYLVHLHVNVGFGDDPVFLAVFASGGGGGGGGGGGPHPLMPLLVPVRVGKHKTVRLMVEVFDLFTGAMVESVVCPFQAPAYRAITLTLLGPAMIEVTARRGKHTVIAFLPA